MRKLAFILLLFSFLLASWLTVTCSSPQKSTSTPQVKATPVARPTLSPVSSFVDEVWANTVQAAKKEGSLTIYSFSIVGDTALALSQAFGDKYGIKVNIISGRGAEFLERIKMEQRTGQVIADVWDSSAAHALNIKPQGYLVNNKDIPGVNERNVWILDPLAADPEGYLITSKISVLNPWINTKLVGAGEEPISYRDLLKPRWKSKIMMADPYVSSSPYQVLLIPVLYGSLDMNYISSLGQQDLKFAPGITNIATSLARGEVALGLPLNEPDGSRFASEGAPVKAVGFEEGSVGSPSVDVVIKNSPHPKAAKVFVNWLISQEGQSVFAKAQKGGTIRKDVSDFRHPAAVVSAKRVLIDSGEYTQKIADAFGKKTLVDLLNRK